LTQRRAAAVRVAVQWMGLAAGKVTRSRICASSALILINAPVRRIHASVWSWQAVRSRLKVAPYRAEGYNHL
jgi:hypothetical protein